MRFKKVNCVEVTKFYHANLATTAFNTIERHRMKPDQLKSINLSRRRTTRKKKSSSAKACGMLALVPKLTSRLKECRGLRGASIERRRRRFEPSRMIVLESITFPGSNMRGLLESIIGTMKA
jgi:hypothetical protein